MNEKLKIRVTIAVLVLVMAVLVAGFVHRIMQPVIFSKEKMETYGGVIFDKPRIFRDPVLIDQDGKPFDKTVLQGKWTLIFFGFTYCPDVCPTTMGVLNKFYLGLQEKREADGVQIMLVSVDPARDNAKQLRDYVKYFNQDFGGLTGEYMDLVRFTTDLSAGFTKVPLENGNYLMEHSGNIAVINPRGHFHGFFKPPFDPLRLRLAFNSMRAQYERDFGQ
ncbi:MAG: SCO family protein [Pseudomonadales bacterium]|nr:SCO family protein [Pseudomonadales bacterium]